MGEKQGFIERLCDSIIAWIDAAAEKRVEAKKNLKRMEILYAETCEYFTLGSEIFLAEIASGGTSYVVPPSEIAQVANHVLLGNSVPGCFFYHIDVTGTVSGSSSGAQNVACQHMKRELARLKRCTLQELNANYDISIGGNTLIVKKK